MTRRPRVHASLPTSPFARPSGGMPGVPWNEKRRTHRGARRAAEGLLVSSASLWVLATVLVLAALYADVAPGLVRQWAADDDYTHGFLILPLALYFVWERARGAQAARRRARAALGAGLLALGLLMLVVGSVGAELFLQRFSLIVVLAGLVWLILGTQLLRELAFPIAFLRVHGPAARDRDERRRVPAAALRRADGDVLHGDRGHSGAAGGEHDRARRTRRSRWPRPAAASARCRRCSRSGRCTATSRRRSAWKRWALVLLSIPIAIAANAFRVAGTGFLAHYVGPEAAQGFYHSFAGWIVFVVAFVLLLGARARCFRSCKDAPLGARRRRGRREALALRRRARDDGGHLGAARVALARRAAARPQAVRGAAAAARRLDGRGPRDGRRDVLDLLKLTDYVMRVYVPRLGRGGRRALSRGRRGRRRRPSALYVGYYGSQRTGRDLPLAQELPAGRRLGLQVDRARCRA